MMNYGDKIEVHSQQEGFEGSYFSATFLRKVYVEKKTSYLVQYDTLVKDDQSGPLVELVLPGEVRPRPPKSRLADALHDGVKLKLHEKVDAFDRDGWWVGKITGRDRGCFGNYLVYFDFWNVEISYPISRLRFHQEWVDGSWISSSRKIRSFAGCAQGRSQESEPPRAAI